MKIARIFSSILVLICLCIACSQNQTNEEITVQFGATSTVIVNCENTLNDHLVCGHYFTSLPNKEYTTDTLTISETKNAALKFNVTMPLNVALVIDDEIRINLLLIPNDTLFVTAQLSDSDSSFIDVKFKGKCANVNEYTFNRDEKFGYELKNKESQWYHSEISLTAFEDSMNYLNKIEKEYFNNYKSQNSLPEWFIKYETNRIDYHTAANKLHRRYYHKYFLNKEVKFPPKSEDFVYQIKIDNKDAVFNNDYYNFFSTYLGGILPDSLRKINSLDDRVRAIVPYDIKMADSLLTGEQRDMYKCRTISLYLIDQGIIGFADSIITSQEDKMKPKYLKFLKDELASYTILEPGTPAANFYLPDENDKYWNLTDFKGSIVLLNFWYPGCIGCRKQIPEVQKILYELKDFNFTLINICSYTTKEKWLKAIDEFDIKGINLLASDNWTNMLVKNYKIRGMSHYTIIDENGLIISNNTKRPSEGLLEDILKIVSK